MSTTPQNETLPAGQTAGSGQAAAVPQSPAQAPAAAAPDTPKPRRKRSTTGSAAGGKSTSRPRNTHTATGRQTTNQPLRPQPRSRRWVPDLNDVPLPWLFVVFGLFSVTPVGFVLLLINLYYLYRQKAKRNRVDQIWHPSASAGAAPADPPISVGDVQKPKTYTGLMVAGMILAACGGFSSLAVLLDELWILTDYGDVAWFLEEIWPTATLLFGGLACCFAARRLRTSWLTRRKIANIVGDADHIYIADLAASLGCSTDKCIDHLENCLGKGVFGPKAYLDMHSMALVVRGDAPPPKQAAPAPAPAPEPAAPARQEETPYDKVLQELRRINDAIPGEEMSAKISRLEVVAGKIFAQLQSDPDKLPQLRKFLDYYLPTSLKLLNTYAELDAQDVEGANITESKRRIEQLMDTLVTAFENQLDKLFQDDALDVSTDIEVMEKMLYADGLTGSDDPFGLQHKAT